MSNYLSCIKGLVKFALSFFDYFFEFSVTLRKTADFAALKVVEFESFTEREFEFSKLCAVFTKLVFLVFS